MTQRGLFDFNRKDIARHDFAAQFIVPYLLALACLVVVVTNNQTVGFYFFAFLIALTLIRTFVTIRYGATRLEKGSINLPFLRYVAQNRPGTAKRLLEIVGSSALAICTALPGALCLPIAALFTPAAAMHMPDTLNYFFPRLFLFTLIMIVGAVFLLSGAHASFGSWEAVLPYLWHTAPILFLLGLVTKRNMYIRMSLQTRWPTLAYMPAVVVLCAAAIFLYNFDLRLRLGIEQPPKTIATFAMSIAAYTRQAVATLLDLPSLYQLVTTAGPKAYRGELTPDATANLHLAVLWILFLSSIFVIARSVIAREPDQWSTRVVALNLANVGKYEEALVLIEGLPSSDIKRHYDRAGLLGHLGQFDKREVEIRHFCQRHFFQIYAAHPHIYHAIMDREITSFYGQPRNNPFEYAKHQAHLAVTVEGAIAQSMLSWFYLAKEQPGTVPKGLLLLVNAAIPTGSPDTDPLADAFRYALQGSAAPLLALAGREESAGISYDRLAALTTALIFARNVDSLQQPAIDSLLGAYARKITQISAAVTDAGHARLVADALMLLEGEKLQGLENPAVSMARQRLWKTWASAYVIDRP